MINPPERGAQSGGISLQYRANTPEGTRDRLFTECRDRRQIQSRLTHLFRRRGYAEIITPETEFYDLFVQSGNPLPQEAMLKIIDRSGKICVMRPDCTIPIARVAATKLRDMVFPQRLYYNQTVFRSSGANQGGSGEIAQCGIELIGASGVKADMEVVAMAVDALRECGLEHFHIELGHADFFRGLAGQMEMEPDQAETMRQYIETKNFAALNDLLEPYRDRSAWRALHSLSRLFGDRSVLDEAQALTGGNEALDYLREIYALLDGAGYGGNLRFDLGLVHQIDYYTGLVFRGYAEGYGAAVLSGGRYDRLAESFGRSAQATGFSVDVDGVAACLPPARLPERTALIHFEKEYLAQAMAQVDMREPGTAELSPCGSLEKSRNLAREKGIPHLILVDGDGAREVPV